MFNFFKKSDTAKASRKSFARMQEILCDAHKYSDMGHDDVSASLLRLLSWDSTKTAQQLDPPVEINFDSDPDAYIAYLERTVDNIFDAAQSLKSESRKRQDVDALVDLGNAAKAVGLSTAEAIRNMAEATKASSLDVVQFVRSGEPSKPVKELEFIYPHIDSVNAHKPAQAEGSILDHSVSAGPSDENKPASRHSPKTIDEQIKSGECVSDRGIEHCGFCVDTCEAKKYRIPAKPGSNLPSSNG